MPGPRLAFFVYIVASARNGTIYIGMTDDLARRIWEHKFKVNSGLTAKYGCDKLVWYEIHESRETAFVRERQIKEWRSSWKLMLIEAEKPTWNDLYETLNG
jgi:putative endonuclease